MNLKYMELYFYYKWQILSLMSFLVSHFYNILNMYDIVIESSPGWRNETSKQLLNIILN